MAARQQLAVGFPFKGLDENTAKNAQPPGTTLTCQNMRPYDPQTGRARGAQRAGLAKYCSAQMVAAARVQDLTHVVTIQTGAPGQSSLSIRTIKALGVVIGISTTGAVFTALIGATGDVVAWYL